MKYYVRYCRADEVIKRELIPVVFRYRFLRTTETSEINVLQLICEAIKKVKGTVYPENSVTLEIVWTSYCFHLCSEIMAWLERENLQTFLEEPLCIFLVHHYTEEQLIINDRLGLKQSLDMFELFGMGV